MRTPVPTTARGTGDHGAGLLQRPTTTLDHLPVLLALAAAGAACSPEGLETGTLDDLARRGRADAADAGTASEDDVAHADAAETPPPADDAGTSPAGDTSNVARIGPPAALTVRADGTWTFADMLDVAGFGVEFYREHPDDYDFLAVYTEGEFTEFWALAVTVSYTIRGIGIDDGLGVDPGIAGSAGRLQQINLMNTPQLYAPAPADTDVLVHETAHRWGAYVLLDSAPTSDMLLDGFGGHWNVHVHTGGPSTLGYGALVDLGGGRFRFTRHDPLRFSPVELYLAGWLAPAEVPPLFYVVGARDYDPATSWDGAWGPASYGEDVSFSGTRRDFSIADLIATNGVRVPAAGTGQREFRFAFVLVCRDVAACDADQLAVVEAQRRAFPAQFAAATGGHATALTTL
jgi:hypothetical protein